jgi:hypothetical protein
MRVNFSPAFAASDYFFVFTARIRPGTTVRQISHTVPSHAWAVQCSRP